MAMLSVVAVQVKPGRMDEFVKTVRELKEIEDRKATNLRSMRMFTAQVGGSRSGRVSIVFEYDNLASWGATVDAELKDPAFLASASQPDDPAELVDQTLYVEIPF
jgi:hypothetical protein